MLILILMLYSAYSVEAQVKKINVPPATSGSTIKPNVIGKVNTNNNLQVNDTVTAREQDRLNQLFCMNQYALHRRCETTCFKELYDCIEEVREAGFLLYVNSCYDEDYDNGLACSERECNKYFSSSCPEPSHEKDIRPEPTPNPSPKGGSNINVSLSDTRTEDLYHFSNVRLIEKVRLKIKLDLDSKKPLFK